MEKSTDKCNDFVFPSIDNRRTGGRIKNICTRRGYTVKELQEVLQIGAFQSIYDWYSGKTLPSLDNMLALSRLLGLPIEDLIVCKNMEEPCPITPRESNKSAKRAGLYYYLMMRSVL